MKNRKNKTKNTWKSKKLTGNKSQIKKMQLKFKTQEFLNLLN